MCYVRQAKSSICWNGHNNALLFHWKWNLYVFWFGSTLSQSSSEMKRGQSECSIRGIANGCIQWNLKTKWISIWLKEQSLRITVTCGEVKIQQQQENWTILLILLHHDFNHFTWHMTFNENSCTWWWNVRFQTANTHTQYNYIHCRAKVQDHLEFSIELGQLQWCISLIFRHILIFLYV